MKPKVDQDKCIGCGTCEALCRQCFKLTENGKSQVINDNCSDCNLADVVSSCPVSAISLEE